MRIKKTSETRALAGNIVNAYSESQNSAYSSKYCNEAFGGTVLWTNPSPTSNFDGQNIALNSSDYDCYEIIYKVYKTEDYYINSGRTPKGHGKRIMQIAGTNNEGPYNYIRDITYNSDTSLTIGACNVYWASSTTTNNAQMIPVYVIGYKTGLFN